MRISDWSSDVCSSDLGVVADHAAERVVCVRGLIGTKGQMLLFGSVAQIIEHATGLHACALAFGVNRDDAGEVLRAVDDDGDIAALPGEAGAAAAQDRKSTRLTSSH